MSKSVQKHCLLLKALNIPVDGGYEGIGICQVCVVGEDEKAKAE